MLGNYSVAAQLVASRVVFSSTELLSYIVIVIVIVIYQFMYYVKYFRLIPNMSSCTPGCRRNPVEDHSCRPPRLVTSTRVTTQLHQFLCFVAK
jgi:hypothetical protein